MVTVHNRCMGLEEGQSCQAKLIPVQTSVFQMFAVFILKGFPLMMLSLVLDILNNHLFISQSIGESSILSAPPSELWKQVAILLDPLAG